MKYDTILKNFQNFLSKFKLFKNFCIKIYEILIYLSSISNNSVYYIFIIYFLYIFILYFHIVLKVLKELVQMTTVEEVQTRNAVEEVHGQIFEVGPRYINLSYIGEGAYGMVV